MIRFGLIAGAIIILLIILSGCGETTTVRIGTTGQNVDPNATLVPYETVDKVRDGLPSGYVMYKVRYDQVFCFILVHTSRLENSATMSCSR